MIEVQNGQCGMCVHFGEDDIEDRPQLVQIRASHRAPEDMVKPCGLPGHAQYNLWVTPRSGCSGFAPAEREQLEAGEA